MKSEDDCFLGRKAMTNLNSVLKSRDVTLPTKVHIVKAMVFPVVIHGCESWTEKKAEHQRIDAFKLWCWRRLLKVPWTARTSHQSILRENNPEYSLEGLMLKLQDSGHLMQTISSLEKSPMLGKIESGRIRGCQRMRRLDGVSKVMGMNLGKLQEMLRARDAWRAAVHGVSKSRTWLANWTTMTMIIHKGHLYFPSSFHIYTETCISNLYKETSRSNRSFTRISSSLPSFHKRTKKICISNR